MKSKYTVIFSLLIFLLTGCWDREELNDVAIVTGIAVDPGKDTKYKLTVEAINSAEFGKQSAKGNTPVINYSLEGNSLPELSNKMNVGLTRKVIYSHTRVLFINEDIAKEGALGFLDFMERSGNFRNDFKIIITKGNQASDFTKISYPIALSPSLKLHNQVEAFAKEWAGNPGIQLNDFISALISKGRSPVAPTVVIEGNPKKGKTIENNQSLEPEAIIAIDGLAVFNNEKMVGSLSLNDSRNYLWTQKLDHTSISVSCGENQYLDVRVNKSKKKMNTTYKNGTPHLKIKIIGEAELQGMECTSDISKVDVNDDYEQRVEKHIRNEITSTIKKVQEEYGVDIYGFGEALSRDNPKKYKKVEDSWNEEFSKADVDVTVDIDLLRTGIRNKGFKSEMEETK